ncbi:MAG: fructose-specific PTS transporter subunit EIIC [Phycisphaerales bacterium]|nr:PTS transporter subunit EIIC [Planctomycetota bacterium]
MIDQLKQLRQHLLTGVSYAIPFVACGGILIAAALAFAPLNPQSNAPDPGNVPVLMFLLKLGVLSFKLMLPILAAYISYSIAGKPGLVAGAIGGFLCNDLRVLAFFPDPGKQELSAGFLGAIVAGLLAGYTVALIKTIPTHRLIRPVMPILIIPIVSTIFVGAVMMLVLGPPIVGLMAWLTHELDNMQTGNAVVLAAVIGGMIAFDMGGPVNKVAFFFSAGLIEKGNCLPMGACAAAICTPPLGMGLATLLGRKLWSEEERDSGLAALGMGTIGITEGAIPFAAADPLRVIPCLMGGSIVASVTAMLGKVGDHAPHGGPIVLPVVDNRVMYIVAILAGTLTTALLINTIKALAKAQAAPEASE